MSGTSTTRLWYALSALIVCADQLSKQAAEHWLQLHQQIAVMPFFNLMLAYNRGAAFSFLSDAGGWQRWFFVCLSAAVSTALIIWLWKLPRTERRHALALALILGGAIGNLIDRLLFGQVIDFIDWYYPASDCIPFFYTLGDGRCHWPTFNIADAAISVGAILLIVGSLLFDRHKATPL